MTVPTASDGDADIIQLLIGEGDDEEHLDESNVLSPAAAKFLLRFILEFKQALDELAPASVAKSLKTDVVASAGHTVQSPLSDLSLAATDRVRAADVHQLEATWRAKMFSAFQLHSSSGHVLPTVISEPNSPETPVVRAPHWNCGDCSFLNFPDLLECEVFHYYLS